MLENHLFSRKITQYTHEQTSVEPKLLEYLIEETKTSTHIPSMLCGRVEGRLLNLLVKLTDAKYCVEVGTFTGYSALSIAEALPPEGKLLTCEIRVRHAKIAQKYFDLSPHGHKIDLKLGQALETLALISNPIDFCFIDADKLNYQHYYNLLIPKVKSGGLMVFDNALYNGEVLNPTSKNAKVVHALNTQIKNDSRVEQVMLTIRDGILLVRKK
jgi:caffeoyl-CoA O-methyltransferase